SDQAKHQRNPSSTHRLATASGNAAWPASRIFQQDPETRIRASGKIRLKSSRPAKAYRNKNRGIEEAG
ncbi:MAG TPA: hypothetical protein VF760_01600, partial [Xanthobacteraceae bacterium]